MRRDYEKAEAVRTNRLGTHIRFSPSERRFLRGSHREVVEKLSFVVGAPELAFQELHLIL
jgi:hypothetical protein